MARHWRGIATGFLLTVFLCPPAWSDAAAYDELPAGAPAHVAQFYYAALELPGVAGWDRETRLALLDAATLRHRDRLLDRAPAPSADAALRHVERLAASEAMGVRALAQSCAQHGLVAGPCAAHVGHVRRARVLEEMLAQGRLTLAALEAELAGAPRPRLREAAR